MARLMQGAALLLLLATIARADDWGANSVKQSNLRDIKLSTLEDKNHLSTIKNNRQKSEEFLESLLLSKACYREWIRDEECGIHVYLDANKTLGSAKASKLHPEAFSANKRVANQTGEMMKIYDKSMGHFEKVLDALQDNLIDMIKFTADEEDAMKAFKKHLDSQEFEEMISGIKSQVESDSKKDGTLDDIHHNLVMKTVKDWVEAEKLKSTNGTWHDGVHIDWDELQNKIPDTEKYRTTGQTPVAKEHLQKHFTAGFNGNEDLKKQYNKLKEKSAAYLQAKANRMRHEAMRKSNSLIAIVMHSVEKGISHMDMDLSNKNIMEFTNKHAGTKH